MNVPPGDYPHLVAALHALDMPPGGSGWNLDELRDLLPAGDFFAAAAVLVGLVPRREGTQVLLTRRTEGLRHHGGQVSFPGGRIEATDRDAVAAAIRETREEIGLPPAQIAPLGFLDPLATITGFRVLPVVAMVSPDYIARPDPGEVAEVFEVPLDFLLDPVNRRRERRRYPEGEFEYHVYDFEGRRIWGATAGMIVNFLELIGTD